MQTLTLTLLLLLARPPYRIADGIIDVSGRWYVRED